MRYLLFFFLALLSASAHADRDIVYAARYYNPPDSRGTSHFHLYRINLDGTGRRQITFGNADDNQPQWSPKGQKILFRRTDEALDTTDLCLMNARSGAVQYLMRGDFNNVSWSPDGGFVAVTHEQWIKTDWASATTLIHIGSSQTRRLRGVTGIAWSPDSRRICAYLNSHDEIIDLETERTTSLPSQGAVWLNNSLLVSIQSQGRRVFLVIRNVDGRTLRRVLCRWLEDPYGRSHIDPTDDPYLDSIDAGEHTLVPLTHVPYPFLYVQDVGSSGNRPDNDYWKVDLKTGKMTRITSGQFLAWSPNGRFYCTAPYRDLTDYGKVIHGYQKSLYTASLIIGSAKTGKEHEIVSGAAWVTGADWKPGKR